MLRGGGVGGMQINPWGLPIWDQNSSIFWDLSGFILGSSAGY